MTVFLALLLALFLGVNGVLLDYARAQLLSYQTEAAAAAAVESVFAGYSAALWEEYELFGRSVPGDDVDRLTEETLEYASEWGRSARGTFTGMGAEEGSWEELVFLTDENGAVFREQASGAIRNEMGEILTSEWKKRLGLADDETAEALTESAEKDSLKAEDVFREYEDAQESLEEAEESAAPADGAGETASAHSGDAPPGAPGDGGEAAAEGAAEQRPKDTRTPAEKARGQNYLDLVDTIRKVLTRGILGIVVPEGCEISGAPVPGGLSPSSLSPAEKGRSVRQGGGDGSGILFREYLMRHMTCFTTDTEKSPRYELEYLIAGKASDEANLKSAVYRLLAMRLGMNLIHIRKSPEKQAAAMEAAALAVGWTGQPALVELVNRLIQTAWAAAESLWDVRHLLGGGTVPLLKTDADWNLSLEGAAAGWRESSGEDAGESGLSYADHLRICLYLKSAETLSYRGMDVIQWNIRRMDRGFLMSACLVEGKFTMRTSGRLLFRPMYRHMISGGDPELVCEKHAEFSYLSG